MGRLLGAEAVRAPSDQPVRTMSEGAGEDRGVRPGSAPSGAGCEKGTQHPFAIPLEGTTVKPTMTITMKELTASDAPPHPPHPRGAEWGGGGGAW